MADDRDQKATAEGYDVLVVNRGRMRPAVTRPEVIGVVVRVPDGEHGDDEVVAARIACETAKPLMGREYAETLTVIVDDYDQIGVTDV